MRSGFERLTNEISAAHVHGFCVLNGKGGLYTQHLAYKKADERVSPVYENGLWRFLMDMPSQLNSMLPVAELTRITTGNQGQDVTERFSHRPDHFDQVDVSHYPLDWTQ